MKFLDLSFPDPERNLACDEALLDACDAGQGPEVLRCWEAATCFVVVGYANAVATEVRVPVCREKQVPILRRCTGGGTVLQGPGVLNYSLILRISAEGPTSTITETNIHVMTRHQQVFSQLLGQKVHVRGHTDLALADRKFSGNAQRRKRDCLLFHGSILLGLDFHWLEEFLPPPSKAPNYRAGRDHSEFLVNLPLGSGRVKAALRETWAADALLPVAPLAAIDQLVQEKYSHDAWNLRF
jgi:lipoate-protein ligase A